jgi:chromate transporter
LEGCPAAVAAAPPIPAVRREAVAADKQDIAIIPGKRSTKKPPLTELRRSTDGCANMKKPTLCEILKTVLYIGAVGYGGPAILVVMKRIIVHEKEWISEKEFMDALSLSQILPGAIGVTLLGYIGHRLKGLPGGILAPFTFALPAMITITVLAWAYFTYGTLHFVQSIFTGLGALVVALLINAALVIGKSVFKKIDRNSYKGALIPLLIFPCIYFFHWNVVYVIPASGALGILFFYFSKEFEQEKVPRHLAADVDDAPGMPRLYNVLPLAVLIVFLATVFLSVAGTWSIFATFLKIGMLGFGGGFGAIPVIQHIVVDGKHWLDLTTFRDGIALGQITPGPVFITATFIGYKVQGIIGALIATIGIFVPSLTAIILIGHAHAKIKDLKIVRALIQGVLSGFIGLLFSVVLQFGFQSLINWQTWVIFIISFLYLTWWKKDAVWLILGTIIVSLILF